MRNFLEFARFTIDTKQLTINNIRTTFLVLLAFTRKTIYNKLFLQKVLVVKTTKTKNISIIYLCINNIDIFRKHPKTKNLLSKNY